MQNTLQGAYPLKEVFHFLHQTAINQSRHLSKRFADIGCLKLPAPPENQNTDWRETAVLPSPSVDEVAQGIALNVLFHGVLPQGHILAQSASDYSVRELLPEELFFEFDPPSVPTIIRTATDIYSFYEFRPLGRYFAFIDTDDWSIRSKPILCHAYTDVEAEYAQEQWASISECAGSDLLFRSSKTLGIETPLTPGRIAQRCKATIDAIVKDTVPRSKSPLYESYVSEIAQYICTSKPQTAFPNAEISEKSKAIARDYDISPSALAKDIYASRKLDFKGKNYFTRNRTPNAQNRGLRVLSERLATLLKDR